MISGSVKYIPVKKKEDEFVFLWTITTVPELLYRFLQGIWDLGKCPLLRGSPLIYSESLLLEV